MAHQAAMLRISRTMAGYSSAQLNTVTICVGVIWKDRDQALPQSWSLWIFMNVDQINLSRPEPSDSGSGLVSPLPADTEFTHLP